MIYSGRAFVAACVAYVVGFTAMAATLTVKVSHILAFHP